MLRTSLTRGTEKRGTILHMKTLTPIEIAQIKKNNVKVMSISALKANYYSNTRSYLATFWIFTNKLPKISTNIHISLVDLIYDYKHTIKEISKELEQIIVNQGIKINFFQKFMLRIAVKDTCTDILASETLFPYR